VNFLDAMKYLIHAPAEDRRVTRKVWGDSYQVKIDEHGEFLVNDGDKWGDYGLNPNDVMAQDWKFTDKWENR
jgi:hypothetical protein